MITFLARPGTYSDQHWEGLTIVPDNYGYADGIPITNEMIERLSAEAEEGYEVISLGGPRPGVLKFHNRTACEGRSCCLHNPSDHHMRNWTMVWRPSRRMMERLCPHGIGHPDPDHMDYVLRHPGPVGERDSGVHGCDGCCQDGEGPEEEE